MRRERTEPGVYCAQCEHRLNGLRSNRCPECGLPFDPDDPASFIRSRDEAPASLAKVILFMLLPIVAAVVIVVLFSVIAGALGA